MALNGTLPELAPTSSMSLREVTLRVPMVRKGSKSMTTDPLSMLATFYAPGKTRRELRTIVDNVSIEIEDGYRLALIGRNGAGKTTLLRLLAGSFTPTRGVIITRGQVQALLNLSFGFRGAATGLENIYLRGLSMGMTLQEIGEKLPEIVEFSELGDAVHDPIQTYSAGMRARLAFSLVFAHVPNILLMDEWISAGDRYFVAKAQERLEAHISQCRTLVLASHSKPILTEICTHGLVLDAGRVTYFGKIDDALKFYDDALPSGVDYDRWVKRASRQF
jgi:ABC-type polysaccharide/polyol phosphate transport system ATPase subunit